MAPRRDAATEAVRSLGAADGCGIGAGLVELLERFGIELQIGGAEQLAELIEIGRAGDRSGDARLREQPGEGYASGRRAVRFRDSVERVQNSETALIQIFLHQAPSRALGQIRFGTVLA